MKLLAAAAIVLAAAAAGAELSPRRAQTFEQVCAHCHLQPGIGVPVLGDETAWAERREKGFEALLRSTVEGVGGMPPLGTCGYCSEADLRALIVWLADMPSEPADRP